MRRKDGPEENARFKRPTWPLLVAGLALVALLAVSCGGAAGEQQRAEEPAGDEQASVEKSQVETEEPQAGANLENPSLGDEGAPVVMIEYADYQ